MSFSLIHNILRIYADIRYMYVHPYTTHVVSRQLYQYLYNKLKFTHYPLHAQGVAFNSYLFTEVGMVHTLRRVQYKKIDCLSLFILLYFIVYTGKRIYDFQSIFGQKSVVNHVNQFGKRRHVFMHFNIKFMFFLIRKFKEWCDFIL